MTDQYAVIGNPISHSQSPLIHGEFAKQTGQNLSYDRLFAPLGEFAQVVNTFVAQGGKGLNITLPFKGEAFDLAQVLTPHAQTAAAVNTAVTAVGNATNSNTAT
mgnify:CR=1 FL=1